MNGSGGEYRLEFEGFKYLCRVAESATAVTEPLVVVGGMMQDRNSWTNYDKLLLPHLSLVTVELPGFGAADALPPHHGYDFLAGALRHLLVELDIGSANLLGTCYGGAIALRCAQLYPRHVSRLMLGAMTGHLPSSYLGRIPEWRRMVAEDRREELAASLLSTFVMPPDHRIPRHAAVWRMLSHQFRTQGRRDLDNASEHNARMMLHEWYRPLSLDVPAIVYTGEHDHLTTPALGRQLARDLRAPFATFFDADHMFTLEQDAAHADLLVRFCTDRPLTDLPYLSPVEHPGEQESRQAPAVGAGDDPRVSGT
ncbi:alpha/beta hydrolase [Streptomyces sp. NPDC005574]|uniref:alpha/beta fold hydrolase n=1 Tax=Streptomyces sp. NPDC005574 TaxID=3156891 RepID=UPI0033A1311B